VISTQQYEHGERLIEDATFIKSTVIPLCYDSKRWNIVVFETYRVTELYLKSLFYFSGHTPRESHELNVIIDDLCSLLEKEKWNVPFLYSLVATGGNCYGIRFVGNNLQVFKRIANVYSQLGSAQLEEISADELIKIKIEMDGSLLKVFLGEKVIFAITDSDLTENLKAKKTLVKPSDKKRIDQLKSLVSELRTNREQAFYSERLFTKEESSTAIDKMNSIINLSKSFLVHEKVS